MTPPHPSTATPPRDAPGQPAAPPGPLHRAPPAEPAAPPPARPRRRLVVFGALAVLAAAALAFGLHVWLTRFDQTTDDAQVEADVVPLAARVSGPLVRVLVQDNQQVRQGETIAQIDPADYQARVRQAEAELATATAQAQAADAQIGAAQAAHTKAEVESAKADQDLRRAERLRQGDAIPAERFEAAKAAADADRAAVATATAQLGGARAQAELAHARVQSAQAALDLARLQLSYTRIAAPSDGVLSKLAVHVGQLVAPGQPIAELVPGTTYVVANFKETQIGLMKPGDRADVSIDAYPGVKLEGRVESLSGGTGARFSLIPPDNASGNFVKVVERVPVRITWTKPPPVAVVLRAGLSADVTVHTR